MDLRESRARIALGSESRQFCAPCPAGPHLQQEAHLVHALVLGEEALEKQVQRLHGFLVQRLTGQSATLRQGGYTSLCGRPARRLSPGAP